jgi:hypothetical protein
MGKCKISYIYTDDDGLSKGPTQREVWQRFAGKRATLV